MVGLITTLLSFLLTGLIGNWLVQRWQQRNWRTQYTLQASEKNLETLRSVAEEILKLADSRIFRTKRLVWQLNRPGDSFEMAKIDYARSVTDWNDRFNAFCVTLTIFGEHAFTQRLQQTIQPKFVEVSGELDKRLRETEKFARASSSVVWFETTLNEITGMIWKFSRDLANFLLKRRNEAYNGVLIPFCRANLELFSRRYLVKALFKPLQDLQPISSTSLDPESPFFSPYAGPWIYEHRG
jgi:hypothetical protein